MPVSDVCLSSPPMKVARHGVLDQLGCQRQIHVHLKCWKTMKYWLSIVLHAGWMLHITMTFVLASMILTTDYTWMYHTCPVSNAWCHQSSLHYMLDSTTVCNIKMVVLLLLLVHIHMQVHCSRLLLLPNYLQKVCSQPVRVCGSLKSFWLHTKERKLSSYTIHACIQKKENCIYTT